MSKSEQANELYQLGIEAAQQGEFGRAVTLLFEAAKKYDTDESEAEASIKRCFDTVLEMMEWLYAQGIQLFNQGRYEESVSCFTFVQSVFAQLDLQDAAARCDVNLGAVYKSLGQYGAAEQRLIQARAIFVQLDLQEDLASCNLNLGAVYKLLGQYERARLCYEQARKVFDELGKEDDVTRCDLNIGNMHNSLGQYELAELYLKRVREAFARSNKQEELAGCDLNLGNMYNSLGQHSQAEQYLKKAREGFTSLDKRDLIAGCDLGLGNAYSSLGQYKLAESHFNQAREIFSQIGIHDSVARCDLNLGHIYKTFGRYETAGNNYRQAREIFAQLGIQEDAARCDLGLGSIWSSLGQYDLAVNCYKQAREVFIRTGKQDGVASCDLGLGYAYESLGQYDQAKQYLKQARDVFTQLNVQTEVAGCDLNLGNVYDSLGEYNLAESHFKRALTVFNQFGILPSAARCEGSLGNIYNSIGQYEMAETHYRQAREMFAQLGIQDEVASCDLNLGNLYDSLGRYRLAERYYRQAREAFMQLGAQDSLAGCNLNLGNLCKMLGRDAQAEEYLKQAREVFSTLNIQNQVASCDLNLGGLYKSQGQYEAAADRFTQARKLFDQLGIQDSVARCEGNLGIMCESLGQYGLAEEHLKQARDIFVRLGLREELATCDLNLGNVYTQLGWFDQAMERYILAVEEHEDIRRQLTSPASRISYLETFISIFRNAIRCCLKMDKHAEALYWLERSRSRTLAEEILSRVEADEDDIGTEFYSEVSQIRTELYSLTKLVGADRNYMVGDFTSHSPENAITVAQQKQRRQSIAELKDRQNKLHKRIAESLPSSRYARILARADAAGAHVLDSFGEYQQLLRQHRSSALLDFLAWDDEGCLRAFLITEENGLEFLTFPRDSLKELQSVYNDKYARLYTREIPKDRDGNDHEEVLRDICQEVCEEIGRLIFNAEVEIKRDGLTDSITVILRQHLDSILNVADEIEKQSRRLYIIPHLFLTLLPLHAACWLPKNSGRWHFLLEDYEISYAPSAYVLKLMQDRKQSGASVVSELPSLNQRALVVGNPWPLEELELSKLDSALYESKIIADILNREGWQVTELYEEQATKIAFLSGQHTGIWHNSYNLIHIAQHGNYDFRQQVGSLVFVRSSEQQSEDEYLCYDAEIAAAELGKTDCVIGSVCLSSVSSPNLSEYQGIGAAFLLAGAGNYIGSLYSVHDAVTRLLMEELIKNRLDKNLRWSAALRQAQLAMLKGNVKASSTKFDHPYYWAAFIAHSA